MLLLLLLINLISGAVLNYTLIVDYKWMTVDNFTKAVIAINNMNYGPVIRGFIGDIVNINVVNNMWDRSLTMHWHGLKMRNRPWLDGVPGITQCGIESGMNMTYSFPLEDFGTHFYHSHTSMLRDDACYGAFIIDDPNNLIAKYDEEHVIFLSEIYKQYNEELVKTSKSKPFKWIGPPRNLLVNAMINYTLNVDYNKTYLLRFISATLHSYLNISISDHNFNIVEIEGSYTKSFSTQKIWINSGERYTVLLNANKRGCYYINVSSFSDPIYLLIKMKYPDCDDINYVASIKDGIFNTSLIENKYSDNVPRPNKNLSLIISVLKDKEGGKLFAFNNISFEEPTQPILLSYYENSYQSNKNVQMIPVEIGDVMQVKITNKSPFQHNTHVHHHSYYVLGSINPITRDTVTIHEGESVSIIIIFDNPSISLSHCHSSIHSHVMGLDLIFAYPENSIPRPPEDFLICGRRLNQKNKFEIPVYVLGAAVFVVSISLMTAIFYIYRIKGQSREQLPLMV